MAGASWLASLALARAAMRTGPLGRHVTLRTPRHAEPPGCRASTRWLRRASALSRARNDDAFVVVAPYEPSGDQPSCIEKVASAVSVGSRHTLLKGATGTGKTFVVANIIADAKVQRPTLVVCHNKTLVSQIARELKVNTRHLQLTHWLRTTNAFVQVIPTGELNRAIFLLL